MTAKPGKRFVGRSKTPLELMVEAQGTGLAARQARVRLKYQAQGLAQVSVWVPEGKRDELRAFAAKLRGEPCPPSGNTGGSTLGARSKKAK